MLNSTLSKCVSRPIKLLRDRKKYYILAVSYLLLVETMRENDSPTHVTSYVLQMVFKVELLFQKFANLGFTAALKAGIRF